MRLTFIFEFQSLTLRCRVTRERLPAMAHRSKLLVVSVAIAILSIATISLVLRDRLRCAGFAGEGVLAAELPATPAREGNLRIVSWNVRNFPLDERPQDPDLGYSRRTNICDLESVLGGLDADVLGLQEVNDTRRFPPILRRACGERKMAVRFSTGGGRHGQHLAIAWDDAAMELTREPIDISTMVLESGMRPGFAAHLRSRRPDGVDFTIVVVHNEAGSSGFADRRRQNRALAEWIGSWVEESGDSDVVLLGDFNTTGSPRGGLQGELKSLDAILGRAGMSRLVNETGCSSYWEGGGERDGVQKASLLDHVFLGGISPGSVIDPVRAWLHCERRQCSDLISRPGEEDGTFWDVSDHCPLTFEIRDSGSQLSE